jgi:hypothetical protein
MRLAVHQCHRSGAYRAPFGNRRTTVRDVPRVVSTGEVRIGSLTLIAHQLSDGQRVIDHQSVVDFFTALENGTLLLSKEDADAIASLVKL